MSRHHHHLPFDRPSLALIMFGINYVIASFDVVVCCHRLDWWWCESHLNTLVRARPNTLLHAFIWHYLMQGLLHGRSVVFIISAGSDGVALQHLYIFPKLKLLVHECASKQDVTLKNFHCLWAVHMSLWWVTGSEIQVVAKILPHTNKHSVSVEFLTAKRMTSIWHQFISSSGHRPIGPSVHQFSMTRCVVLKMTCEPWHDQSRGCDQTHQRDDWLVW